MQREKELQSKYEKLNYDLQNLQVDMTQQETVDSQTENT